jgi:DNA gyrase inhibitor GyrI
VQLLTASQAPDVQAGITIPNTPFLQGETMASNPSLDVSTQELTGWRVASLTYHTSQATGDFDQAIRNTFDRVKTWVREQGETADSGPAIGIASVNEGKLQAYECCIPISDTLQPATSGELSVKTLPGGKYVIVKMEKQSEVIGETIRRFFEEYVPTAQLQLDQSRPTYEVYWETTMDFCVPILE